jgi:hypothetical protein
LVLPFNSGLNRLLSPPFCNSLSCGYRCALANMNAANDDEVGILMRTLLGAGFVVNKVQRKPNCLAITAKRFDEFGIASTYLFGYAGDETISDADCAALSKVAETQSAALVLIGNVSKTPKNSTVVSREALLNKFGGAIPSLLPLEPLYGTQLTMLARNFLPDGLAGKADDVFELYVHSGLQFLLRGRVIRYGQQRRFEVVPDGIVIANSSPPMLYDCKAAESGYDLSRNSIRQFADYVNSFRTRWGSFLSTPLHAFLVISSEFQDVKVLQERSNELYGECAVPLVCMTAECLKDCVAEFVSKPHLRPAIDWRRVFVPPLVEMSVILKQIDARMRDEIIHPAERR